jgi:hypothetical protein
MKTDNAYDNKSEVRIKSNNSSSLIFYNGMPKTLLLKRRGTTANSEKDKLNYAKA